MSDSRSLKEVFLYISIHIYIWDFKISFEKLIFFKIWPKMTQNLKFDTRVKIFYPIFFFCLTDYFELLFGLIWPICDLVTKKWPGIEASRPSQQFEVFHSEFDIIYAFKLGKTLTQKNLISDIKCVGCKIWKKIAGNTGETLCQ